MLVRDRRRVLLFLDKHSAPALLEHGSDVDDVFDQWVEIFAVEKASVNDCSSDGQIVDKQEERVGRTEPGLANLIVLFLVESVVGQNGGLVVGVAVVVENCLRHERI